MYVTVAEWDNEELVPVAVTCIVSAAAKVHDSVELPETVTLVGLTVHEVLFVVKLTIPAKAFRPVTMIVEVASVPLLTVMLVRLAEIEKSGAGGLKNSVIGVAEASLLVREGSCQTVSKVFRSE